MSVLDGIGNTPLVSLERIVPRGSARLVAKLEWANPTGSMKDRMARAVIEAAEARGDLRPGGTIVEYTMGTTGISLAFVGAARGYDVEIVYSPIFSEEKRRTMQAFGARITDVTSDEPGINQTLVRRMIETAGEIGARPGHWQADQLRNADAVGAYHALGDELWRQSEGRVDAFVHAMSTSHSLHGTARALRRHRPALHVAVVEPAESAILSGGPSGGHGIEGIGIGFVPPLFRRDEVDEIVPVSTADAKAMARRLAREEGIFAGTSSGANVVAALRVAERLGEGATVATIMCDSGLRYLSTDVFRPPVTPT
jgi:cysteine synthase A